jgi:hypothetical protein
VAAVLAFGYLHHNPEAVISVVIEEGGGEGGGGDDDAADKSSRDGAGGTGVGRRRLLSAGGSGKEEDDVVNGDRWFHDVSRVLSLAIGTDASSSSYNASIRDYPTWHGGGAERGVGEGENLRVLLVITSLVEYDVGTRGTKLGRDRLMESVLPNIVKAVESMTKRNWYVDVYLILGYPHLDPDRRQIIRDALPVSVGLEIWEDAIPLHYAKKYNKERPGDDQGLTLAYHALSRQHRYVLRDKVSFYDFFACFVSMNYIIDICATHV